MNRIPLSFVFCLGFGSLGIQWAAAQYAPQQAISPRLPSTVVTQPSPVAAAKPSVTPQGRQNVVSRSKATKEPEQMKIVGLYRGQGFFDAALAEKLRPVLVKAFGVTPATGSNPGDGRSGAPDLLRSIFGQKEGSEKSADENAVVKTDQP
jgi:hypothetical protein